MSQKGPANTGAEIATGTSVKIYGHHFRCSQLNNNGQTDCDEIYNRYRLLTLLDSKALHFICHPISP
jgi:hypothetical protein